MVPSARTVFPVQLAFKVRSPFEPVVIERAPELVKLGVVTEVAKVGLATVATVIVSVAPPVVVMLVPAAIVTVSPRLIV